VARKFAAMEVYGSAFGFALESEGPHSRHRRRRRWPGARGRSALRGRCTRHARRERVDKLTVIRQEVDERIPKPIHCLDRGDCLGALDRDPAATWPSVVEQLIATERDAARSGTKGVA
jgi:hypothetical protein